MLPFARKKGLETYYRVTAAAQGFAVDNGPAVGPSVEARLNHGRWIADCPDCAGAQFVDETEPIFFCLACGNVEARGQFRRVKFPRDKAKIEGRMNARPMLNRNWEIRETIEDLDAENERHGILAEIVAEEIVAEELPEETIGGEP